MYIYLSRGPASKCLHCVDWRFRPIIISRGFQRKHWDRCDSTENWPALDIFLTKFVIILFGFWNLPDYLNNCGCEGQSRQNVEGWDEHVEPLVCMQVYHFLCFSLYYNGMREVIKWQLEDKKITQFQQNLWSKENKQLTFGTTRYAWCHVPKSNGCWGNETKIERIEEWPGGFLKK